MESRHNVQSEKKHGKSHSSNVSLPSSNRIKVRHASSYLEIPALVIYEVLLTLYVYQWSFSLYQYHLSNYHSHISTAVTRSPSQLPLCVILIPTMLLRQTALTLCLSADETAVYAVSSRGVFSAWSMYQSGQRIFEHRLDDPYFAQDAVYPRNCWGRQFALAAGGKHILSCSTSGGVIYRFDNRKMVKVLGLKVREGGRLGG